MVLAIDPDVIVDFGSVTDTYKSLADRVQAQTGISYVLIDGRFENSPRALRRVGDMLGVPDRGERLAAYFEKTLTDLDAALESVPRGQRPRVYLARGPAGLETGLKGSINTEIIKRTTREFYELFYHMDLSEEKLDALMRWSQGRTSREPADPSPAQ